MPKYSASTIGLFTVNVIAPDGTAWAVYFEVDTYEQAEHIVEVLGLKVDESGVGRVVECMVGSVPRMRNLH